MPSRGSAADALKEGGRANSAGRRAICARHVFVAAQVAAAFILLAGAGLLMRSFQRVMNVDIGYDAEGVIAAYLPLRDGARSRAAALTQYIQQLLDEVRAVPGMREAAVTTGIPLRGWGDGMPFRLPAKPDEIVGTGFKIVTPGYFQTLGLRLIAGRLLDSATPPASPPVVVVNESFVQALLPRARARSASAFWSRRSCRRGAAWGRRLAWEIVGVVADEKGRGLESATDVGAYASFAQSPVVGLGLVAGARRCRRAHQVDPASGVAGEQGSGARSPDDRGAAQGRVDGRRAGCRRMLLGGFAVLAMLLACAGIYGVLSFVTAKRTQELGIRAALGASRWDLVRMVIGSGAMPVRRGHRGRPRRRDRAGAVHPVDAVPDPPRRRAHADRRRRAVPGRRAARLLRAGVARGAHRPDVRAAPGLTPLVAHTPRVAEHTAGAALQEAVCSRSTRPVHTHLESDIGPPW